MQHRETEVDPDQGLDQRPGADHLRDQIEARDDQGPERSGDPGGALVEPEREDVGHRELARVAHPLGQQVEHDQERDQEADRVQESVEAEQEDQPGDAQERCRRHVVAGDREPVLHPGDPTSGGPERCRVLGPLRGPVGDPEGDRDDHREDRDRLDIDLCEWEEAHQCLTSRPPLPWPSVRGPSPPAVLVDDSSTARSAARFASGSNIRLERRRYSQPRNQVITNWVSASA